VCARDAHGRVEVKLAESAPASPFVAPAAAIATFTTAAPAAVATSSSSFPVCQFCDSVVREHPPYHAHVNSRNHRLACAAFERGERCAAQQSYLFLLHAIANIPQPPPFDHTPPPPFITGRQNAAAIAASAPSSCSSSSSSSLLPIVPLSTVQSLALLRSTVALDWLSHPSTSFEWLRFLDAVRSGLQATVAYGAQQPSHNTPATTSSSSSSLPSSSSFSSSSPSSLFSPPSSAARLNSSSSFLPSSSSASVSSSSSSSSSHAALFDEQLAAELQQLLWEEEVKAGSAAAAYDPDDSEVDESKFADAADSDADCEFDESVSDDELYDEY